MRRWWCCSEGGGQREGCCPGDGRRWPECRPTRGPTRPQRGGPLRTTARTATLCSGAAGGARTGRRRCLHPPPHPPPTHPCLLANPWDPVRMFELGRVSVAVIGQGGVPAADHTLAAADRTPLLCTAVALGRRRKWYGCKNSKARRAVMVCRRRRTVCWLMAGSTATGIRLGSVLGAPNIHPIAPFLIIPCHHRPSCERSSLSSSPLV